MHRFNLADAVEGVHYYRIADRVYPIVRGGADGDTPDTPPATPPETPPPAADTDPDRLPDDHKVVKAMHDYKSQRDDAKQRLSAAEAELETLRTANLSDQEKAVSDAEKRGAQTATEKYGLKLAAAELKAAGVPADKVGDLPLSSVLDDNGDPDPTKVADLAARHKAAPAPTPGSADGGPQGDTPTEKTLDEQIAAAQAKGDTAAVISLNNQKLAAMATGS